VTAWGRGRSVARPVRANLVCRGGSTVVRTDVISLYLFVFKRLNGVVRGADNSYDDFRSVFGLAGWVEHALGSCSSPSEGLRWASRHPVCRGGGAGAVGGGGGACPRSKLKFDFVL
jgi:hypothetical protein